MGWMNLVHWVRSKKAATPAHSAGLEQWFDASFYLNRYHDLAANLQHTSEADVLQHYLSHGWREGRQPHPCFEPGHYLQELLNRGIAPPADRPPLQHFLQTGQQLGLTPSSLAHAAWMQQRSAQGRAIDAAPTLADLHPWGAMALSLCDHSQSADSLLAGWIQAGIPSAEALARAGSSQPLPTADQFQPENPAEPTTLRLRSWPGTWQQMGWLAALPAATFAAEQTGQWVMEIGCHSPTTATLAEWLRLYPGQPVVVADHDPDRCRLLQRFGVCSQWLPQPSTTQLNQWLPADPWLQRAEQWLGLPPPSSLIEHGVVCLGPGGPFWDQQPQLTLPYLPGFNDLQIPSADWARAQAAWLWHCHQAGIRLVEFRTQPDPLGNELWLPLVRINPYGLDQAGLLDELEVRRRPEAAQRAQALNLPTPQPDCAIKASHGTPNRAQAAVLVSLYNYESHILRALESVRQQTLQSIELVVVDDASQDQGPQRVAAWMAQWQERFSHCVLLSHRSNGGLAAARNSAFRYTQAPWCFVLDADNTIAPQALEQCLTTGHAGSPQLAVVHPLIRRVHTDGHSDGLIAPHSWQREAFLQGNVVDAMALVRRSAWQQVNGYTHIPGGWEDYDFWCKLIEHGFHGSLCPYMLGNYHIHEQSMVHQSSHRNTRNLSRLLQQRHPWLKLPLGGSAL